MHAGVQTEGRWGGGRSSWLMSADISWTEPGVVTCPQHEKFREVVCVCPPHLPPTHTPTPSAAGITRQRHGCGIRAAGAQRQAEENKNHRQTRDIALHSQERRNLQRLLLGRTTGGPQPGPLLLLLLLYPSSHQQEVLLTPA